MQLRYLNSFHIYIESGITISEKPFLSFKHHVVVKCNVVLLHNYPKISGMKLDFIVKIDQCNDWFHDFLNQNVQKEMESQIIKYLQMNLSLNLFRKQKLITHSPVLIISVITTARVTQWHMFSVPALFLVCFCKLDILSYQHDREMY